ncbi:hypothetical protein C0Q70_03314 [Pomacea canaliculata]|uniref:Carbohydrate kinase PfkB domain-containing protein n=2 Tax=Pomacea canaliculata TaxID=400727 RepID=A0A2T7PSD8_POMCA|nr:ketohexokinase-like isoform X2 [Pomacea canaliculata]PVD36335.1 hypothetical protein C0Q70_03314 [Pomacea canaliculata]
MEGCKAGTQKKVLSIGLVCLDIIKVVSDFPREDTDQRCLDCLWRRGGNASNSASVLSLLGASSEFLGSFSAGPYLQFLQSDFKEYGISITHCPIYTETDSPVSVVIVNRKSGSRTILHTNKNLRELCFEDFKKINVKDAYYSWIHFEGRSNVSEIKKMLLYLREHNDASNESNHITTSLEVEKPERYSELRGLMDLADYIFVSKEVAQSLGYCEMKLAVNELVENCRQGGTVICPWGDCGAAAKRKCGTLIISPAFPPEEVIDTLGAGDTFIGAAVFALNQGENLQESVKFACKVAGAKCGIMGNQGLRE